MSLISDLLSKVKKQEPRRDVPPILKDEVLQSAAGRRTRKRLTIALVCAIVLVAAGFGVLTIVESLKGPSLLVRAPVTTPPAVQSVPPTTMSVTPPQAEIRTSAAAPAGINASENAIKSERGKDSAQHIRQKKVTTKKYAEPIKPEAKSKLRGMKQEVTAAGENTEMDKASGSTTRQDKDINLYMARTYEAQRNYGQAIAHYKRALSIEPKNYVIMNNIAGMLIYMGSYKEAIQYAEKALNIRKNYVSSLINIGIGYGYLGNNSESEGYFRKALTIEPSNRHAILNLGLLYEKQGTFDMAGHYYQKLSEAGDAQGYLGLARIAEKQEKVAEAIRFYRMALSMENIDPHTSNMINERLIRLTK